MPETRAPRTAKKTAAKKTAAAPVTTRTGLTLDPADPEDAKILARQAKVARAAGREGQDRAKVTAGRPDLAHEFDQGEDEQANEQAAAADEDEDDEGQGDEDGGGPGTGERARSAFGKGAGFLSRGSYRPTLSPPRRARDAGGLAFGLLLYTAAITYIRYGPAGWTGWLSAKFLNRPLQGLPSAKGGPPTSTALEA